MRRELALLLALTAVIGGGCRDAGTPATKKGVDEMPGVDQSVSFDDVILGATEEHACSPRFGDVEGMGIRINSPPEVEGIFADGGDGVVLSDTTRFPVCITMKMPTAVIARFLPEVADRVTLVAIDTETGASFSNNLTSTRTRVPPPRFDPAPVDPRLGESFDLWRYNVNLCRFLRLGGRPATYHVYATFEEYRSNSVTVRVK